MMKKIALWLCLLSLLLTASLNQVKAQSQSVSVEDIKFESKDAILSGTIYIPQYPHAAVVLVHGSGQATRMRDLASILSQNGILVLTYDKRGVGESGGTYAGPEVNTNNVDPDNLALLAEDANIAVNVLHLRDRNLPIGLVGISQAGWIIPIAAKNNPLVEFMVLFSGPLVPTLEQLRFQFFTDGNNDFWDNHTEAEARESVREGGRFDEYFKEYLHLFVSTDPNDALTTLSIPGLWIFGEKDIQIPVGLSIESLNTLKAKGKPYEYCLFSKLGHNTAFSDSPEPVNIVIHWIKDRKHCIKSKSAN